MVGFSSSLSKWKLSSSPFQSLTILKSSANSAGDVLRDLDKRALMTGDFLLVSGDVVSNLTLGPALTQHRARREKDRNAIMTMILREAGNQHRTKSTGRRPIFVIDPIANRCVHYEEIGHREKKNRYIKLDPELLTTHSQLDVRADLIDCYIDICTPEVLSLWSDNFDYQSVRQSFLAEVLKDYELNGKTIHTYIAVDKYAARVQSLRAYDAVTKDIIERWTYPLCPDSNLVSGQNFCLERGKIYQEGGVRLERNSVVKGPCILGQDTNLADGCLVSRSVLGRRCRIGKDVVIENSYLWDDVEIGEGTKIQQAVIADHVLIGKHCQIEPGALISFGVSVPQNTIITINSKMARERHGANNHEHQMIDTISAGKEEFSHFAVPEEGDSDTSSTTSSQLVYQTASASVSTSSISTLNPEGDDGPVYTSSRRSSVISEPAEDTARSPDFHLEAYNSVLDGIQKGDLSENILLELNSYRMAMDANQHEVRRAVVAAFMKRIWSLIECQSLIDLTPRSPQEAVKEVFGTYRTLIGKTIFDKEGENKTDQVDLLILVQKELLGKNNAESVMLFITKEVYDLEIVEEDGILQWWEDERSKEEELGGLRGLTEQFIVFLREAEEESDDSSEVED